MHFLDPHWPDLTSSHHRIDSVMGHSAGYEPTEASLWLQTDECHDSCKQETPTTATQPQEVQPVCEGGDAKTLTAAVRLAASMWSPR